MYIVINRVINRITFLIMALFLSCGCRETIVHNLSEAEANKVVRVLANINVKADKLSEGKEWAISVDKDQVVPALAVVEEYRLLGRGTTQDRPKSGFVQSREEKEWQVERDVAASLEDTMERLPGVLEARVHINMFSQSKFDIRPSNNLKTGSVLLVVDPDFVIDISQIKSIIKGASGVGEENVSVVVTQIPKRIVSVNNSTLKGVDLSNINLAALIGVVCSLGLIGYAIGTKVTKSQEVRKNTEILRP